MYQNALTQAASRLTTATNAYGEYLKARSFADKVRHWTTFLVAVSTIYSKLEQGAKANGKSGAWFGRIKRERKVDPLLAYLHHARNSDEHGIEEVSKPAEWAIDLDQTGGSVTLNANMQPLFITSGSTGDMPGVRQNFLVLVPVADRNVVYEVPNSHLGQPLIRGSVEEAAPLALAYLEKMLEDASRLASC